VTLIGERADYITPQKDKSHPGRDSRKRREKRNGQPAQKPKKKKQQKEPERARSWKGVTYVGGGDLEGLLVVETRASGLDLGNLGLHELVVG